MKPPLLFLAHRIPYPPNKGDKIRSFHLLRHLARRYRVFLGTFVDDPQDRQHIERLDEWCAEHCVRPLRPGRAKLLSLRGLLSGQPLTLPYYRDRSLQRWVSRVVEREGIRDILIYSSAMGQYVTGPAFQGTRRLTDLVDVDSDKWRQYAGKKPWPMSWIYRREADRLLAFERRIGALSDAVFLVSDEEAALFRKLAPELDGRIHTLRNGVDLEAFDPEVEHSSPYAPDGHHIVFTGAMDYWPNVDAVVWFADEVLPSLRERFADLQFHIVGSHPAEQVRALAGRPGVEVTGAVEEIQPWIAHADVAVAPMRIARGIQNKVLEAMAMARPVVVSPMGLEGIGGRDGEELLVAEQADEFVAQVSRVLDGSVDGAALGRAAREKVLRDFAWDTALPLLDRWFDGAAA